MCSAMPRRMAVIGSRVSPATVSASGAGAAAGAGGGGAACGAGAAGASVGAGAGATAGGGPDSMNARMSFFVTRPPAPVPAIWPGSTPCSDAMRATTGDTNFPFPDAGGAAGTGSGVGAGAAATGSGAGSGGAKCGTAAGGSAGAGGSTAATGAASGPAEPSGAMTASLVPTSTVSPSCTRISCTTPAPGLGTSVSTLSVEISSSGSSWAIASPGCLSHLMIVPSDTDTPIWGMTTSTWVLVAMPISTPPARATLAPRRRPAG